VSERLSDNCSRPTSTSAFTDDEEQRSASDDRDNNRGNGDNADSLDFFSRQARLQAEAKLALAQVLQR